MKVRFGADTKQFKKGMNDGKKAVQTFKNDAGNALEQFANQFGVSLGPLSGVLNKATTATKGLSAGMKGAAASTNIFTKALKIFKVALISTGIGALVVALGSLITYFTKTQRGADKVSKVMAGFRAIMGVLIDRLSAFGEGLFKIFTGRFKEGWDALKESAKGVGEEMKNEAKAAYDLEAAYQALERREIDFIKTKQRLRNEISDLILKTRDENIAAEERLKYIEQAQKKQKELSDIELGIAEDRAEILRKQQALGENMIEDDRELAEAEAKINDLRREGNDKMRELVNRYNEMTNKINASTEAIIKQREEFAKNFKELDSKELNLGVETSLNTDALETDKLTQWTSALTESLQSAQSVIVDFSDSFNAAFEDLAVTFGESMGDLLAGTAGFDEFGKAMMGSLADTMSQVGKLIIKAGIAFFAIGEAFKKAITNPATALLAVAAGAALVAAGQAFKTSLSGIASGGGGTYSGNAGVFDTRSGTVSNTTGTYEPRAQKVQVEVVGKIENDVIKLAYDSAKLVNELSS